VKNLQLKKCSAQILEPKGEADTALSFTAGLVLGVLLDAELHNLAQTSVLRVKVKYPDQTTQLLVPCKSDLRSDVVQQSGNDKHSKNYRLRTTVLLSHGVWTEACSVESPSLYFGYGFYLFFLHLGGLVACAGPVGTGSKPRPQG